MKGEFIRGIVKSLNESPYRCILIDGRWGIGKTYEIDEGRKSLGNSVKVSLFGISSSEQLYQSLLWKLIDEKDYMRKGFEAIKKIAKEASVIIGQDKKINAVLNCLPKEKKLVEKILSQYTAETIIFFDDIERISPRYELQDFFGLIENLLNQGRVKVILAANTAEFNDSQRETFDKYNEKFIDKIYTFDTISSEIDWASLRMEEEFVKEFINRHDVGNLRTLQKASQFYLDVKSKIDFQLDDEFDKLLHLICFSIVTEQIEKIYLSKLINNQSSGEHDKVYNELMIKNIEYRIEANYLSGIQYDIHNETIGMLCSYYQNEGLVNEHILQESQKTLRRVGEKANFLKSDEELRATLESLMVEYAEAKTVGMLINRANVIVVWEKILGDDTIQFLDEFEERLQLLVEEAITANELLNLSLADLHLEDEDLKEVVSKINREIPKLRLNVHIKAIKEGLCKRDYEKCLQATERLESILFNVRDRTSISSILNKPLIREFLPLGSIEEEHWTFIRQYVRVSSRYICNDLRKYFEESVKNHQTDKAFLHRMNILQEDLLRWGKWDSEEN